MSLERFCTVTPLRRTSSGNRGSASCTRLFRLKVAWSTLVPTSNVAVIVTVPCDDELDVKYSKPSTPESCSSMLRTAASGSTPRYGPTIRSR